MGPLGEAEPSWMGPVPLYKRSQKGPLPPSAMWGHTENTVVYDPASQAPDVRSLRIQQVEIWFIQRPRTGALSQARPQCPHCFWLSPLSTLGPTHTSSPSSGPGVQLPCCSAVVFYFWSTDTCSCFGALFEFLVPFLYFYASLLYVLRRGTHQSITHCTILTRRWFIVWMFDRMFLLVGLFAQVGITRKHGYMLTGKAEMRRRIQRRKQVVGALSFLREQEVMGLTGYGGSGLCHKERWSLLWKEGRESSRWG